MRTKQRNFAIAFISFIMAIAMVFGISSLTEKPVSAVASSSGTPSITMVSGAQARYDASNPGIKFTAEITNYDSSYTYGMLILPEKAFENLENFEGRYHAYFTENGITNYVDFTCHVYNLDKKYGENPRISLALTDIHDYTMGFVGIGYAKKGETYVYAPVNMADNARSIAFVAQMALKYEQGLNEIKTTILNRFINGNFILGTDDYLNNGSANNSGDYTAADYAMKYIFNASGEVVSQVTDVAYEGGTAVSFKYYIPEGTVTSWWGIAYSSSNTGLDIYAAADETKAYKLSAVTGTWVNVSFTLPEGGPYYLFFGSEVGEAHGRWMVDGENSYALIDDFKIGSVTETFANEDINDSIFTVLVGSGCVSHCLAEEEHAFGGSYVEEPTGELAMKYVFNVGGDSEVSHVSKTAYAGGSTVSFKYYIPEGTTTSWWRLSYETSKTVDYYGSPFFDFSVETGVWKDVEITLPAGGPYYLAITSEVGGAHGRWMLNGKNAYALIDNFTVNGEVEDFNDGVAVSMFEVLNESAVMDSKDGEGYYLKKKGDLAMKIVFNVNGETVSQMTNAIPGGSQVRFSYYIPSGSTTAWWGIAWHTDPSKANVYHAAGINDVLGYKALSETTGAWLTADIALPAGGPYYLYFGAPVDAWYVNGDNGYVLIDNFTINGEVETFDYGIENSCFRVLFDGAVLDSEGGEIIEDVESMIVFDGETIGSKENIAFITGNAYSGVQEINFRARWLSSGNGGRWGLSYTSDPTKFGYDDGKPAQDLPTWINCYTPRFGDLKMDDDVWYDYKVVISSGMWHLQCSPVEANVYTEIASGNYYDGANYFYFMICPTASGDTFELYDFSITTASGTVTDNFDNNRSWMFVNSITKNADHGSTGMKFVEQPTSFEPEELGDVAMKFVINDLTSSKPAMITKEAYAGGLTISFKYYIPEGTVTSWWGIAWHTDPNSANIYHAGGASSPVGYQALSKNVGYWTDVSLTLPAGGPYYLYFGGEINDTRWRFEDGTKAWVLIDEFKVGDVYESFNFGVERSIFNIKENAARNSEIGDGWVNPYPAELGAKIYGDKISSTATTPTFITKQAYTFTEPTVVSFDYYMTGNTNSKWWILAWTNNQRTASIYAHVENNKANNDGRDLPTNVQDSWAKASVEVPAGTWYFYIGMAKGEWSGGHVIIDNFKIGDQVTETFNNGITDSIFVVSPFSSHHSAIEEVEGIQPFVAGEYSASLNFTNSFDQNSKTFITKKAYAGGSTVSFMFNIPEGTTIGDWWSINWDTNNTSPNFWAVGNGIAEGSGGINPTGGNKTSGTGWVEYSFTLPAGGPYYLYIVGYQNWNGVVYIDNFTVNGEVETFNNGFEESIFNVGNSSYVTLGEGVENSSSPEIPEEPENEDENALENLIKDGTIVDFLEDGGYASITTTSDVGINNADIPSTMILVEGTFKYTITGEKEFAIYLGNGQYIVIDQDSIALYIGTSLIKEVAVTDTENEVALAITAGGKVIVGLDRNFIGLGVLTNDVEMVKLVALGGNGKVNFKDFDIITYKCLVNDIPMYYSAEDFDFTAYAFDSVAMISDTGYSLLADAGFTKTLALLQGRVSHLDGMAGDTNYTGNNNYEGDPNNIDEAEVIRLMEQVNKDAIAALDLAEKYGLKHYVFNEALYNLERHTNWYGWVEEIASRATYKTHPAFAGHFLADEPQSGKLFTDNELEEMPNAYKAYMNTEFGQYGEAFINLLPRGSTQFLSESYYTDYVTAYMNTLAKEYQGVKGTGYISYDHYPLEDSGVTSTHLRNAEIVAELCRDNGLEFRGYIKASTSGDSERNIRATESVNDLYMQIYSLLCYGVKEVIYYQFTDHTAASGEAGDGVISGTSLLPGNVYNWTKQANNEVRAFEDAYMNFKWKSASIFGKTSLTQFNNLKSKANAYGYLTGVSSSASVLVGNFDDADGTYTHGAKHAYVVMNYGNTDGATDATTAVTMTFNGTPTRVLVYQGGKVSVVDLSANTLTLNLMIGEGAFIIPLI